MKLWLRFLYMKGWNSFLQGLCQWGCASSTAIKPTGTSWGFNFFLTILRTAAAFPLLGDEEFLYLPLALALKRQRKRRSTEQAFCARTLNEWGDPSGRDTKFMGFQSCTGRKLRKLSKLTCPSGPEPQCPGGRVMTDSSCPGKCSPWNKAQRRIVASSLSILPEALTESKKEDNFSLSTACTCRGVCCSEDVGKNSLKGQWTRGELPSNK